MPRRRTGPQRGPQRSQNIGASRKRAMRNNAEVNRGVPFQGGLGLSAAYGQQSGQQPGQRPGGAQRPVQNAAGGCPTGMQPAQDPITGQMTCRPATNVPGQARPVGGGARRMGGKGAGTSVSNRGNTYREGS